MRPGKKRILEEGAGQDNRDINVERQSRSGQRLTCGRRLRLGEYLGEHARRRGIYCWRALCSLHLILLQRWHIVRCIQIDR